MERRKRDRIQLKPPMQCRFRIAGGPPIEGNVVNLSAAGALVVASGQEDKMLLDCCGPVVFESSNTVSDELLCAAEAQLSWSYGSSLGIKFAAPLVAADADLRTWLMQHGFQRDDDVDVDPFKP